MFKEKDMDIGIDGLGFAFYSPEKMTHVHLESDFFEDEFDDPEDIARHLNKGDIVGFCTGTGGDFTLKFREGYPDEKMKEEFPVSVCLGMEVKGGKINVVDAYWLMEWDTECPEEQVFYLEDGFYHITLNTKKPESGIWGDEQTIYAYFDKVSEMPQLQLDGLPFLCEEED